MIGKLLGHRQMETTSRYAHLARDTVHQSAARIADSLSSARAHNDARRAEHEGVPVSGPIDGVRAVITGHTIVENVQRSGNVWHIDTGAGFANGRLTLARIDTDAIETVTRATGTTGGMTQIP